MVSRLAADAGALEASSVERGSGTIKTITTGGERGNWLHVDCRLQEKRKVRCLALCVHVSVSARARVKSTDWWAAARGARRKGINSLLTCRLPPKDFGSCSNVDWTII